ncbi:MAG: PAS domain S-box protein, partial [Bacteroidia bacterium]
KTHTGFLKITRDLTARKNLEEELNVNERLELRVKERTEELKASGERYRQTLDKMIEGVQIHDFNWNYIYVNDALVRHSTYSREELMGNTLMEKYPGIEQTPLFSTLERCMQQRKAEQLETEFKFPNGTTAFFELSIQPIPEGIFILSVDKTEQKKAKEKLLKVSRLYEFISNINKSIVYISDEKQLLDRACSIATETGKFKLAWIGQLDEDGILRIVSRSGDEAAAKNILRLSGLDVNDPALQHIPSVKVVKTGACSIHNNMPEDPVMLYVKEELARHEVHASIALPIVKFGKVTGIFGLFATVKDFFDTEEVKLLEEASGDISFALENFERSEEFKRTQELVFKNEKRFKALIENSKDMKTLTSPEGRFIYASPSVSKLFNYSEEEFIGKPASEFFHPDDIPDLIKNWTEILTTPGKSFQFQYRFAHKEGQWIWCEGTLTNMLHDPAINALVTNFRDITAKKTAEQQRHFDQTNLDALINNTDDLLWSIDRDFKLITCNKAFREVIKLVSGNTIEKGHSVLSVSLSEDQSSRFKLWYTRALSGEVFTETEYIQTPVESWSEISFYPIREANTVIGTACYSRNITERKRTEKEREKMVADITQRNKNAEQFAYIVSHNLRVPVANILGISSVLKTGLSEADRNKSQAYLFKAVEHLDEIVKDLNKVLQIRTEITENKERVCLSDLVSNISSSIHNLVQKEKAVFITDFSEINHVVTLKSYIQSIFYNLISNSIKYKSPGKPPVIDIRSKIDDGRVKITFTDNGIGIDLEQFGHQVFGLYKRFHASTEGKGLGLFMVKTQAEVLGGNISVQSKPDVGTEFTLELPV